MTEKTNAKPRSKRRYAREPQATNQTASSAAEQKPPAKNTTKIACVIALLKRSEGATLDEIVEATGWQPHSARAALTGLKKKGHAISKSKREDATCYRIEPAA